MTIKVAINGFGRIGRNVLRYAKQSGADLDFVAVNDLTDTATLTNLLKYDSILGRFPEEVTSPGDGAIVIGGKELKVLSERDPAALPWGELGVDVVLESTGFFTKRADAQKHLDAGAKKVVISAPATATGPSARGRSRSTNSTAATTTPWSRHATRGASASMNTEPAEA